MRDLFSLDSDDRADLLRAWQSVYRRLADEVSPAWLERFIHPLRPTAVKDGVVTIEVPGRFVLDWVSSRYLPTIETLLSDELGAAVRVELVPTVRNRAEREVETVQIPGGTRAEERFQPNPRFTFDTYVVGQSNRLAVAGAKAVAQKPGRTYNPLFIYGPSGLGKTHLLHAIAAEYQQNYPNLKVVYISAQQFAEEFVNALQTNRIDAFRKAQRQVGVWLVDDIQFVAGKDKTQEELFHTFNAIQQLSKQIVLTADRPPRDLQLMDERLRSRFESGLVADVQMPDTETRAAILRSKADQEEIDLTVDVASYLAEHVPGNIRSLEGALTKLAALASLESSGLSVELAERMVEQYYRNSFVKPRFTDVLSIVSAHYAIPIDEIMGTSRKAPIVLARHVAIFLYREISGDSWKHIGSLLGNRDHTSMIHGYQKISERAQHERDFRSELRALQRSLAPGGEIRA